jgi:hypothetical protein
VRGQLVQQLPVARQSTGRVASPLPATLIPENIGHSLFSKLSTPQQLSKQSKHYNVSLSHNIPIDSKSETLAESVISAIESNKD